MPFSILSVYVNKLEREIDRCLSSAPHAVRLKSDIQKFITDRDTSEKVSEWTKKIWEDVATCRISSGTVTDFPLLEKHIVSFFKASDRVKTNRADPVTFLRRDPEVYRFFIDEFLEKGSFTEPVIEVCKQQRITPYRLLFREPADGSEFLQVFRFFMGSDLNVKNDPDDIALYERHLDTFIKRHVEDEYVEQACSLFCNEKAERPVLQQASIYTLLSSEKLPLDTFQHYYSSVLEKAKQSQTGCASLALLIARNRSERMDRFFHSSLQELLPDYQDIMKGISEKCHRAEKRYQGRLTGISRYRLLSLEIERTRRLYDLLVLRKEPERKEIKGHSSFFSPTKALIIEDDKDFVEEIAPFLRKHETKLKTLGSEEENLFGAWIRDRCTVIGSEIRLPNIEDFVYHESFELQHDTTKFKKLLEEKNYLDRFSEERLEEWVSAYSPGFKERMTPSRENYRAELLKIIDKNPYFRLCQGATAQSAGQLAFIRFFPEMPLRLNVSYDEGGNIFRGKDDRGSFLIVGEEGVKLTKKTVRSSLEKMGIKNQANLSEEELKILYADDYGVSPDHVYFIFQPGAFHLDMKMNFLGNKRILFNDARKAFERDTVQRGFLMGNALRKRIFMEDLIERVACEQLRDQGFEVIETPGVFYNYQSSDWPCVMNFFNFVSLQAPDGKNIMIALGDENKTYNQEFKEIVAKYSEEKTEEIHFLSEKLTRWLLDQSGGIRCITQLEEAGSELFL